ncbi:acyl-CoA dehydrogenase [Kitasatospora cineracea]|uniref:Alkylation response protein AidB-like acyl-CoA dehydrogenase n=1 Tax=Kitasatospora cineracea TaxID=88074 RepID=A0A3N4RX90_9ACTN|nr:acyl-CoA dehydrogenase [Kitasatospora cineracea]RPE33067.1 alkylation response protein AidB-like acyl-CoA dehydrogenase [Kitasatospora cineracea]
MITVTETPADLLDAALGDPWDAANPVGFTGILAADERQEMFAEGERRLDAFGLNAEFVPVRHGGRLGRADRLAAALRTLWRRDPCLGLGYGFSSFIASVNLWSAGDEQQRRTAAGMLLDNRKIASVYHELAHGNDFAHAEFAARPAPGGGWLLNGTKEIVTNFRRADALVVFARTDEARGSRSHSQFFVRKDGLPDGALRYLDRFPSSGMRGVQLGGGRFTDCPVPDGALLGEPGRGIETALKSFQLTRSIIPSMCVGPLDTALRTAVGFALERRLYGGAAADLPYVRTVLGRAFADLLAVDAFTTVVVRALQVLPEETPVLASASKYLASRMLLDTLEELRGVLGAQSYLREGPYAVFQKMARDVAPATFGHASRSACLVTVLPQLPRLARRAWFASAPAPAGLFDLDADLPELDFGLLAAGSPHTDGLAATLVETAERLGGRGPAGRLAARFRDELAALREECRALAPQDITIGASPRAHAAAGRYTVVLAAAAVLGVWWHGQGGPRPELQDEAALLAALDRLDRRLPGRSVLTAAERADLDRQLFDRAVERFADRRLFDLTARHIPG